MKNTVIIMKKILAILLAAMMLLFFVACNKSDNPDPDNVGFTKAQRQVIAEQIGVTTEDEKVVFMYEYEEGDTAVYIDVYDEFNGMTCRYNEWVFCIDKETYDGEYNAYVDDDTDVVSDEKNLYFCMREECDLSWAGSWQAAVDYHNEHTAPYNDDYIIVE